MKQNDPRLGIGKLCRLFGKTRHAWYDRQWHYRDAGLKDELVLQQLTAIRKTLPRIGTLKLHHMIQPLLAEHSVRIGRDYLFALMAEHGMLIRRRKRRVITTDSRHWMRKYSNLIKDIITDHPEQIWVADITYIRMPAGWGYLSLITDAYSRRIMGFSFRTDLSAQGCIQALKMAFENRLYATPLIHHSDRGSQYCCAEYVALLISYSAAISMTENGDPYENALAERVNGIIKAEFDLYHSQTGYRETWKRIAQSIDAYNTLRPHASCDYLTPDRAHRLCGPLRKHWKKKKQSFTKSTCITQTGITNQTV